MKSINKRYSLKKQSGLSLIELMISMFIGLFLLVGITTSYLSSKKSSIVRDQYSILEDNGRIALEVLTDTIKHTGYASSTGGGAGLENKFISVSADVKNTTCGESSVVDSSIFPAIVTKDGSTGANRSDGIGVIYLGDEFVSTDCTAERIPETCQVGSTAPTNSAKIYNAFYVNNGSLMCAGSRNATPVIISEGIEDMQILYGLDVNGDSIIDSYVNATKVDAGGTQGMWANVISVQIAVLVRSQNIIKTKPETQSFTLLDTAYVSPTDRYQRAVFSTTISLRNSIN